MRKISFFLLRLVIYFIVIISPFVTPSIAVPYDLPVFIILFFIVPFQAVSGYRLSLFGLDFSSSGLFNGGNIIKLIFPLLLPLLFFIIPSYGEYILFSYVLSVSALFLTYLLFRFNTVYLSFIEASFYFIIFFRLIGFTTSFIAENPSYRYILSVFLIIMILSYLLSSFFYYRGASPESSSDFSREYLFMLLFFSLFAFAVFVFLPEGSKHLDFILNFSNEKALTGGVGTGNDESDMKGNLKGIPSDRWGSRSRRGGSGNKQYAVMIVASGRGEIYSAMDYLSRFDPYNGFLLSGDNNLNSLKNERFIENWINPVIPHGRSRDIVNTFYLSALPERSVPFAPYVIEPTIYDTSVSPFSYSYSAVSFISSLDAHNIISSERMNEEEKEFLSEYLESDIDPEYKDFFDEYMDSLDLEDLSPGEQIYKILKSFGRYQYEIGYDEDTKTEKLYNFLSGNLTGDCTEFSNTAALLGRLAGIPSRVVRGYLASERLQTPSHRQGIRELRKSIEILKSFPEEDLLLVTTAHKHSWVQFYLSGYGWIDFEATEYAIPPAGMDPNSAQVVVPIINQQEKGEDTDYFMLWLMIIRLLFFTALCFAVSLYIYKILKLFSLYSGKNKSDIKSVKKIYRYLLLRFYLLGMPFKRKDLTPQEYGEITEIPEFEELSHLYTEIIYRENYSEGEMEILVNEFIRKENLVEQNVRPEGIKKQLLYLLSLRGIFY